MGMPMKWTGCFLQHPASVCLSWGCAKNAGRKGERQEPTLPRIDSMQFVDVARIERLENRDKPIGGNIILDHERGQPNQADIVEGKRPQRIAIAGLDEADRTIVPNGR
jgi:hypothetical protein